MPLATISAERVGLEELARSDSGSMAPIAAGVVHGDVVQNAWKPIASKR